MRNQYAQGEAASDHVRVGFGAQLGFYARFQSRQIIPRADFAKLSDPCDSARITEADKRTLKQWLSVRYGCPAYPNAFENRYRI